MSVLRSRSSGGRLVRSTPRQNTRPRSMRAGGALKSTPRKFQFGTGRRGVSYGPSGPPGGALSPFGTQGKIVYMNPQGDCGDGDEECDARIPSGLTCTQQDIDDGICLPEDQWPID